MFTLVKRRLGKPYLNRVDLGDMICKLCKQFFFLFKHLSPEPQVAYLLLCLMQLHLITEVWKYAI